jgi:cellulose synthase/poly-beta-1,6-N-acetylglucosamine synthase-like glycosyltransferase
MVLLFITSGFLLLYACLIFYYQLSWTRLDNFSLGENFTEAFISVIIPARNEEHSIGNLLTHLDQQTYSKNRFEIIVVDDYSTDNTIAVVKNHSCSNLKLIQPNAKPENSSKKKSIEAGIAEARGELIVTTDADCLPGKNWLITLNSFYRKKSASFIAAPVKYNRVNNLCGIFQSLDFMILQGITAASVSSGFHNMCNGANLAYKKNSFIEVNGFEGIDRVATGDDMLLMHKISQNEPGKVYYLKSQHAIVSTSPMPDWKSFFMQRKRWASKTLVYRDYKIIIVLAFVFLLNCLFFVLIGAAVYQFGYWWLVIGFLLGKMLIELPFVYKISKFYKQQYLVPWLFILQPFHIFYTVFTGLTSQFGKYEWKGRRTK